jgi:hypothetical protein
VVLGLSRLHEESAAGPQRCGQLMQRLERTLARAEVRTSEELIEIRDAHAPDMGRRMSGCQSAHEH